MKKKNEKEISKQGNCVDKTGQDLFDRQWDASKERVSYNGIFTERCYEDLQFIAGVLDMLVVLKSYDHLNELGPENAFVFMEARNKAVALGKLV